MPLYLEISKSYTKSVGLLHLKEFYKEQTCLKINVPHTKEKKTSFLAFLGPLQ